MHPLARRFTMGLATLGLLAIAVVVSLGVAEAFVRVIAPQQLILVRADVWQPADSLGWIKRPNLATTINTGERSVSLHTDSLGLRVSATGRSQGNSATQRILLLGDSFMEALQVEYEESVAGLLESDLAASLGTPVEVWNTGVSGWGPSQYALIAKSLLGRFEFDYVLVALYVGNDAVLHKREYVPPRSPTVVHHLRVPRALTVTEFRDALFYPVNDFLERRSHLYIMFKTVTENLRARLGLGGPEFPFEIRRQAASSPRWEVTAEIAREVAQLGDQHDIPVTFVLIPSVYQVDTTVYRQFAETFDLDPSQVDLEQPNRLLERAFTERGIDVIDGLPALRTAHERGFQLYGVIDEHFTPAGHRVLTDLVLPEIAAALRKTPVPRVPSETAVRRVLTRADVSRRSGAR